MKIEDFYNQHKDELWKAGEIHSQKNYEKYGDSGILNITGYKETKDNEFVTINDKKYKKVTIKKHNNDFELRHNFIHQLVTCCLNSSNYVLVDGKNGPANTVITNITVSSLLQLSDFLRPVTVHITKESVNLYKIGILAGLDVYVDSMMSGKDCKVLVGQINDDTDTIDENKFVTFYVDC